MSEFFTIYLFHVKETITKKGFQISTLVLILFLLGASFFSHQMNQKPNPDKILISSHIEGVSLHKKQFNDTFDKDDYTITFTDKSEKELKSEVKKKDIDGAFVLNGTLEKPVLHHYYRYQPVQDISLFIEKSLENEVISSTFAKANINPTLLQDTDELFQMDNKEVSNADNDYGLIYPLIFLMYVFVMGFGQSISMSVVSEKSTKVIEMLLPRMSAIRAFYAKIFSAFTSGLIQLCAIGLTLLVIKSLGWVDGGSMSLLGFNIQLDSFSVTTILWFVYFFFTGFTLYGLLYASLGAKVSRVEDLGSVLVPVVFVVMASFGLGIFTIVKPESIVSLIAGYFPFTSPTVMMTRILMGVTSPLEIITSIVLFFATLVGMTFLCQRWYVQSISHYGSNKKKKAKKQ